MASILNDFENGPFIETSDELFEQIGLRLVLLQELERFITFVAKVVFEKEPEKARDAILKSDKKTMGQLLNLLRTKVNIKNDFDKTLKRVLDSRNMFIHNFSNKFDIRSKNGQDNAFKYLCQTLDDLVEVNLMMKAAILSFGNEKGIDYSDIEGAWRINGDLDHLESVYIPKVSEVFKNNN